MEMQAAIRSSLENIERFVSEQEQVICSLLQGAAHPLDPATMERTKVVLDQGGAQHRTGLRPGRSKPLPHAHHHQQLAPTPLPLRLDRRARPARRAACGAAHRRAAAAAGGLQGQGDGRLRRQRALYPRLEGAQRQQDASRAVGGGAARRQHRAARPRGERHSARRSLPALRSLQRTQIDGVNSHGTCLLEVPRADAGAHRPSHYRGDGQVAAIHRHHKRVAME